MKQKIFFVINYIGPLKYYEKLFPYLEREYDLGFLFLCPNIKYLPIMEDYCKKKGYTYCVIESKRDSFSIPIYSPLQKASIFVKNCRKFLYDERPKKIVSMHNYKFFFSLALFYEANKLNIETIVLQWGFNPLGNKGIRQSAKNIKPIKVSLLSKIYFYIVNTVGRFIGIYKEELSMGSEMSSAKKVGVIDCFSKDSYINLGYKKNSISIVGHADSQLVVELRKKLDSSKEFKQNLLNKYNIREGKKNILMASTMLNRKDIRILDDFGQDLYYNAVFKTLRDILPASEYNILFKLHPSEQDIYNISRSNDIMILDDSAEIIDLMSIADLYIAHPNTTVNYMSLALKVPSIFINFSGYVFFDLVKDFYGIKQVVKDHDVLKRLLDDYKNNKLEPQFNKSEVVVDSVDRIVNFINY